MAVDGLLRRRAPRRSGSSRSSHRPTRDRSPDRPRPRGLRLLFEASLCPGRLDRMVKSGFAGLLSWDSSVRPSIDLLPGPGQTGVSTDRVPDRQSGTGAAHVVSHHLDGSSVPGSRGLVASRCRSWGSPRFLLSRNRISRGALAALRSFPSADSDESRNAPGLIPVGLPPWARVTVLTVSSRHVHREPCLLALFLIGPRTRLPAFLSR